MTIKKKQKNKKQADIIKKKITMETEKLSSIQTETNKVHKQNISLV